MIFSDYIFWVLIAYTVSNFLLWIAERLGIVSPQLEEWNPARWWHSNPHNLQKELFENATAAASTLAQFQGLRMWIEGGLGGWVSPKLVLSDYLSERGRYERRLEILEEVKKDEVLVKLPLSHVLSSGLCRQDLRDSTVRQVVQAEKKSSQTIEILPWTWITLCILTHSQRSDAVALTSWQFYGRMRKEYIDAALSYIPLFWDDHDLQWLNRTDFLDLYMLDVHAAIESEYHKLLNLVPSIESDIPIIEFKKWAMVVMSRGESLALPDPLNRTRTEPQLVIMPLLDLVDHHLPMPERPLTSDDDLLKYQENGSHTNISYNADLEAVVLRAREMLTPKAAVTSGYGVHSNADYLLYHGFTMPHEWSDLTLCIQHTVIELPLPADMPSWKSRFLPHPYRFTVPACPHKKSTPHVLIGAARFLLATEKDVLDYAEQLAKDPSLAADSGAARETKFLHHNAREALAFVCDTKAEPPVCRSMLTVANELAAWELIRKQTVMRASQHATSIEEDDRLLKEDDAKSILSINQRHAVIVRREEKITLRRWCAIVVQTLAFLSTPAGVQEMVMIRLPDETLENEEPHLRPAYWSRLWEPVDQANIAAECHMR